MVLAILLAAVAADAPAVAESRVLLHTVAGDLVLTLQRAEAPAACAQFEKLARAGIYDGMRFYHLFPAFLLGSSIAQDRDQPLNAEQTALLRPLPKKQNALPLTKGAVFFAHNAESADGGVAALGIVLGNAEHLTGRYTVFARVTEGLDVLDELASAPIDHEERPEVHLGITGVQFIAASEVPSLRLPRRSVCSALLAQTESGLRRELAALISTLLFGVGALALLGRRASEQLLRASRLLVLLVSGFGLLVVLYPVGLRSPTVATGLFLGLVALFKLMSRFEAERS